MLAIKTGTNRSMTTTFCFGQIRVDRANQNSEGEIKLRIEKRKFISCKMGVQISWLPVSIHKPSITYVCAKIPHLDHLP
jgi:hypothetical protein